MGRSWSEGDDGRVEGWKDGAVIDLEGWSLAAGCETELGQCGRVRAGARDLVIKIEGSNSA